MKNKFLSLFLIAFSSVLILLILFRFERRPNQENNGFNRSWINGSLKELNRISFSEPLKTICGATENHFYFGVPNPKWIISIDNKFKKKDTILFPIKIRDELITSHNLVVD